jgi:hypothetical protein
MMQHLRCEHCSKILIADFWSMVEGETVRMFSSFSLPCDCGHVVQVVPSRRPRWMKLPDAVPYLNAAHT